MNPVIRSAAILMLLSGLTLAAGQVAAEPMHAQYLPPDDLSLREGEPEQQQLLLVTEYSVVIGNQRQSSQQPIPITSPLLLRLKGKPLNKGATIGEVLIDLLRNEKVYCQFLSYANGHVWADLHTTAVKAR